MKEYVVLSALGRDRVGIADDLTAALEGYQIDIEESRMTALGGEFAIIMLISGGHEILRKLDESLGGLGTSLGFHMQLKPTGPPQPAKKGVRYTIESYAREFPGLVHSVAAVLKKHNINIEDLETDASMEPMSNSITFRMKGHLTIPQSMSLRELRRELRELECDRDLDIVIKPATVVSDA